MTFLSGGEKRKKEGEKKRIRPPLLYPAEPRADREERKENKKRKRRKEGERNLYPKGRGRNVFILFTCGDDHPGREKKKEELRGSRIEERKGKKEKKKKRSVLTIRIYQMRKKKGKKEATRCRREEKK